MLVIDSTGWHVNDSSDDYPITLWNRLLGCEVGFCRCADDGSISGWTQHRMSELSITGRDAKNLAQDARRVVDGSLRN